MHGDHALITRLQGSIIIKENVTIRLTESGGSGDFALTAGWEFDSVDQFLNIWEYYLSAGTGNAYVVEVVETGASRGKIKITNTGNAITIDWAHAGSAAEGARIRDFLGESGNISGQAAPYTFTAKHKAGFYPSRGATRVYQSTRSYGRSLGTTVGGKRWAQCDPEPHDGDLLETNAGGGIVSTDITLSLDGSTDWSELGELVQFIDEVYDHMGEPWALHHQGLDESTAQTFVGYFDAPEVLEIVADRVEQGWNGLLFVDLRQEARA